MAKKVLTIDDSRTLRLMVRRNIAPFGIEVVEAEDGEKGVAQARAEKPDLILLDFNMPVMDGHETLKALKADGDLKDIPVVMLTTEAVKETVMQLIKLGLKGYVVKPFKRDELLTKINSMLGLYEGDTPPSDAELKAVARAAEEGKKRVVAVDDKAKVLENLNGKLGEACVFESFESANEAAGSLVRVPPDVLLLDSDMPEMSGLELFEKTKDALKAKGTQVYFMALRTAEADISKASRAGIEHQLLKPFSAEELDALAASLSAGGDDGGAQSFLAEEGGVKVLSMPETGDPTLRTFAAALRGNILREVSDMADEGEGRLVVATSPAVASDIALARNFVALLGHAQKLMIDVRVVAEDDAKEALQNYAETATLPVCSTVGEAVAAFG